MCKCADATALYSPGLIPGEFNFHALLQQLDVTIRNCGFIPFDILLKISALAGILLVNFMVGMHASFYSASLLATAKIVSPSSLFSMSR